jgi:prepilin-type N-terminal cleavage/methylation domain-containing protein
MGTTKKYNGFTIVELLIVIVVIGILAALVMSTYANVQAKARDARRASDIRSIRTLVLSYQAAYGALPRSQVYGEDNAEGYDISSVGDWIQFLKPVTNGPIPRDPIDNETGDPTVPGAKYTYFYYCYHPAWDLYAPDPDNDTVRIGYRSEASDELVYTDITVDSCLAS